MTELEMVPSMFQLHTPIIRDNSMRSREFIRIQEKTSTNIESLNKYEFELRNLDQYTYIHDSYLTVSAQIRLPNDTAPSTHVVGFLSSHALFSEARYYLQNEMVEDYRGCGVVNSILLSTEKNRDNINSVSGNEYFYKEGGAGGNIIVAHTGGAYADLAPNDNYNDGFRKRVLRSKVAIVGNTKIVTMHIPLSSLFNFVKTFKKVSIGMKHGFSLYKNDVLDMVLSTTNDAEYSVKISKMEWLVPVIKPSLQIENQLMSMLSSNSALNISYSRRQYERSSVFGGTVSEINWRVASLSNKPLGMFVWSHFLTKEGLAQSNNLVPDPIEFTRMTVRYNSQQFPAEAYENQTFATQQYGRLYDAYVHASTKEQDNEAGAVYSYDEFGRLFPVWYFDLSNTDESLFQTGICDLSVHGHRNSDAGANWRMNCLIMYEKTLEIELSSGRMLLKQ